MSIVHLSSIGQTPSNFYNQFPQGINLAPNSEVRCLGYSGMTADVTGSLSRDKQHFMQIRKDENDTFVVYHGNVPYNTLLPGGDEQEAFKVTIPDGTYQFNGLGTAANNDMCRALQDALNNSEPNSGYYRPAATADATLAGWTAVFNTTSTITDFWLRLQPCENARVEAGLWENYGAANWGTATFTTAGNPTRLTPRKTAPLKEELNVLLPMVTTPPAVASSAGTYTNVATTTSGPTPTGAGCTLDITTYGPNSVVTDVKVHTAGSGYEAGQVLEVANALIGGGGTDMEITLTADAFVPTNLGGIFVNKRAGMLGATTNAPLPGTNPMGYIMQINGVAGTSFADYAVTHSITPRSSLTTYEYVSNTTEAWADRKPNIRYNPERVPNSLTDWAFPQKALPWSTFGMGIHPVTGQFMTFNSAMSNLGSDTGHETGTLKQPLNQKITLHATIADIGAGSTIRMAMQPRYNTTSGTYQIDYFIDNNAGAWTFLSASPFGSYNDEDAIQLFAAGQVFHTCKYDKEYVSASTLDAQVLTSNKNDNTPDTALTTSNEPTTLITLPLTDDLVNCPLILTQKAGELSKACNGLGRELGYLYYYKTSSNTTSSDFQGTQPSDEGKYTTATPLIITCPTLGSINGYVGSGGGGGASAPILAVASLRGNVTENGFSGMTQEAWVKINNEYSMRLDRLNIRLVDQTNREYEGLVPDFSCWLQFREPGRVPSREVMAVGDIHS